MNQVVQPEISEKEIVDFPTLITVTCHLMTLYALKPCEPLANNINRHIKVILNSSAGNALGEWQGSFKQILMQWELIATRHLQPEESIKKPVTH